MGSVLGSNKTRAVFNELVGRSEKISLWSDRGGSLRDWRKLFAILAKDIKTTDKFDGLPLKEDEKAIEIIILMSEIFQITYSSDQIPYEERCKRALSLIVRGYLLGKLCVEQFVSDSFEMERKIKWKFTKYRKLVWL